MFSDYDENKHSSFYRYIDPYHLTSVASIDKTPRMKNRRFKDTHFQQFLIEKGITIEEEWGLTRPNVDAFYKNLAKFQKASPINYDREAFNFASFCMYQHFGRYLEGCGIESCQDSIARLDLTKSPGFPFTDKYKDKRALVENEDLELICQAQFDERLLNPGAIWISGTALKEEVRPIAKIIENKIRLFVPNAADFTVLTSMLCGKFNDALTDCHVVTASCVGINPFNRGWSSLRNKLSRYNNCFEGDFSDFDSSLSSALLFEVMKFRLHCYPDSERTHENILRMYTLYSNLVYSHLLLCDGTIVRKHQGNPSGSANTVVDNTLVNYMSLAYCWYRLAPEQLRSYKDFNTHVISALYGDDNTSSISDTAAEFFKPLHITRCMREIGLYIQFEHTDFVTLNEVSFLRSDFRTTMYGVHIYHIDCGKMKTTMAYSEYPVDPIMSLKRACGLRNVTWSDLETRLFFSSYIKWLTEKYDRVLLSDPDWIEAKSGILSDAELATLYLGLESKRQKDFLPNASSEVPITTSSPINIPSRVTEAFPELDFDLDPDSDRDVCAALDADPALDSLGLYRDSNGIVRIINDEVVVVPRQAKKKGKKQNKNKKKTTTVTTTVKRTPNTKGRAPRKPKPRNRNRGKREVHLQEKMGVERVFRREVAPAAIGAVVGGKKSRRYTTVRHTEAIGEVITSNSVGAFTVRSYRINPGIFQTFPWLFKVANAFDMYRFKKISLRYVNSVGSATDGTICMSYDPNVEDSAPTSIEMMMNMAEWRRSDFWHPMVFNFTSRSLFAKDLFVRQNGDLPVGADPKTYDTCMIYVASEAADTANKDMGTVYIDYVVEFVFPESTPNTTPLAPISWNGNLNGNASVHPFNVLSSLSGTQVRSPTDYNVYGSMITTSDGGDSITINAPGIYGMAYWSNGVALGGFTGFHEQNVSGYLLNKFSTTTNSLLSLTVITNNSPVVPPTFTLITPITGTLTTGGFLIWRLYWGFEEATFKKEYALFIKWKREQEKMEKWLNDDKNRIQLRTLSEIKEYTKELPNPTVDLNQIPPMDQETAHVQGILQGMPNKEDTAKILKGQISVVEKNSSFADEYSSSDEEIVVKKKKKKNVIADISTK